NDVEEILCLRISTRPKHADEALRLQFGRAAELFKSNRRLDVVAQDRPAISTSPPSIASIASRSKASANAGPSTTCFCYQFIEAPGRHHLFSDCHLVRLPRL